MVIINFKGGQLANRIILFAHFMVNSMEHKYKLYNPEFDEFTPYFEGTSKNDFEGYPISLTIFKNHFLDRAFSRLFRLWADITHKLFSKTPFYTVVRIFKSHDQKETIYNLNSPEFVRAATTANVVTEGWLFKDRDNFENHSDTIRKIFTPVEPYRSEANKVIAEARSNTDILIGVHIRRGDYERFLGGRWFYSDAIYAEKMLQVQAQYAAMGKRCAFFICSNVPIDVQEYDKALQLHYNSRNFIVDLYAMAQCDGIIGPPSTYSMWASFYGKVPLKHINTADEFIQLGVYESM
ncbi:MAG: alpha-1,2-fucosyltransferase, partial [Ferruginibacter sp.]